MKNIFFIAVIAIIIVLLLTGCTTTKPSFQLIPSQAGLIRFNANSGKTDFLISTPAGMRWVNIPENEVEVILVPEPSGDNY